MTAEIAGWLAVVVLGVLVARRARRETQTPYRRIENPHILAAGGGVRRAA